MRHLIVLCVLQGSRSFFEFDVEKDENYALLEFLLTKMKKVQLELGIMSPILPLIQIGNHETAVE